jgi:NAD(P)-dependent dehydrogenase (short-subunit alcohol dehydrogenase family)
LSTNTSATDLLGCGTPFQGGHAASKAAAANLTESLKIELAPFNIRVVNLTGGVRSTFFDNAALRKLPEPSIYNGPKESVEASMGGEMECMDRTEATVCTKQVAGDLSKSKPPYTVIRGADAGTAANDDNASYGLIGWYIQEDGQYPSSRAEDQGEGRAQQGHRPLSGLK